jgi:hypothetical protein
VNGEVASRPMCPEGELLEGEMRRGEGRCQSSSFELAKAPSGDRSKMIGDGSRPLVRPGERENLDAVESHVGICARRE